MKRGLFAGVLIAGPAADPAGALSEGSETGLMAPLGTVIGDATAG